MFVHHTNVASAEKDARKLVCYDCGVACDLSKMRGERIGFLSKMGSLTPGGRAKLDVESSALRETGDGARRAPEAYRPPQPGGEPERYRLRFSKIGPAALLGHLDLVRELPRIIRRAGVRTAYTRGFHPKPDMTFAPALSLGVLSLDEYVDIRLIGAPDPEELVERLRRVCPDGIAFTAAARLGPNDPRVSGIIDGARYAIALARGVVADLERTETLDARLARFHSSDVVQVRRDINGIGKIIDVKRFVSDLRRADDHLAAEVRRAGLVGSVVVIDARVRITPSGSVKAAEIVEALTGDRSSPWSAVRVALTGNGASPMDLTAHRYAATGNVAEPTEIEATSSS
jgi:radical SAM-linked protein